MMGCEVSLFSHLKAWPTTTDQLASATGTQSGLIRRILRHLASRGTIKEIGPDSWAATDLSQTLALPDAAAGIHFGVPYFTKIYHSGPSYFRKNGYKIPKDGRHTLFNHAFDCPRDGHWEHIQKEPEQLKQNNMMLAYGARYHPSWLDMCDPGVFFDAEGLQDPKTAAFVDIGGGHGVDVAEVRKRFPKSNLPARVVLQDLGKVIEEVKTSGGKDGDDKAMEGVELQSYNFFEPQPVKGAKVYFLASIMHDWPDDDARKILGNIAAAMTKGHSKLLVSDYIVPAKGCIPQVSGLDLVMMSVLGSAERTEDTWHELLASQGLKLTNIHTTPTAYKSLLEIDLVE